MPDLRSSPVEVSVLEWPSEEGLRRQLNAFRVPRLLLVEPGSSPPALLGELEDWIRTPPDPADLWTRAQALRDRARAAPRPVPELDDDGLLRVDGAWVALTPAQTPVVRLLLQHLERVVRTEDVVAVYAAAGGSVHAASVRTLLSRIGSRVAVLGLDLVTVRQRGVLLSARARGPRPERIAHRAGTAMPHPPGDDRVKPLDQ